MDGYRFRSFKFPPMAHAMRINTEKSTNFEYQITGRDRSVKSPPSPAVESGRNLLLLPASPWKNMRPTLENPRWRFESCSTPSYTKRCTPQGHVQTRECTALGSRPLLPPQGHDPTDCLMHATIPPPPSLLPPHLVTEEVDICICGWWRVKRILRAGVSFTRAHIKRYARKSCCQPPCLTTYTGIFWLNRKNICIYIYIYRVVEINI